MTSSELKNNIAQKTNLPVEKVGKTLDQIQEIISQELMAGRNVNIPGFGNFTMIRFPTKSIKDVRNPKKTYLSLEKNMAKFRPSPDLKKELSGQKKAQDISFQGDQGQFASQKVDTSYIDLSKTAVPKKILNLIPEHIARHYQVVPLEEKDNILSVAMIDPEDQEAIEFVKKKTGAELKIFICTQADLNHILDQYSALSGELKKIVASAEEEKDDLKPEKKKVQKAKVEEITETAPAAKVIQSLIKRAVREKASDIHIEPEEDDLVVRFRIDGVLRKIITLPIEIHPAVISRVKILSDLKIDETRLPQDGRFQTILDGAEVDFRISTLPTVNGEKIVARILDKSAGILTLEKLGLRGTAFSTLEDNIHKAHGMVLVTGPTGSGKTTTLYAVIDKILNVGINIVTLEDPVEYRMAGVNQSQVHTSIGFTFANGLRSIVRQDPDVVMVGEIRDYETADMAVHAALTGHVVLSTLHTNDAAGAVPRLTDMKVEPFLINSSVNCVVAQRLCRRICDNCREPLKIEVGEQELAQKELTNLPKNEKKPSKLEFFHGKGCDNCNGSGYKGRIGIFEVFDLSDDLKEMVAKHASGTELGHQAIKNGMTTMKQDGILKTVDGLTTLEEVWRVTKD